MNERERSLDRQLWHACAGGMVKMPPLNSLVFYFPQGHAENASSAVVFPDPSRIPPLVLCRVVSIDFLADPETDEVFATMGLIPLHGNGLDIKDDTATRGVGSDRDPEKLASFTKMLTQSDANNGGGFSVPRYCAETIFPKLDYSMNPPMQTLVAKDVHGVLWKFRHVYRGTPRRHLLTTGWSLFVSKKKLFAGDSIVFLRAENGDLCVGTRRNNRGIGYRPEPTGLGWNSGSANCNTTFGSGFFFPLREKDSKFMRGKDRVRPESVVEAANLAASGQPFKVLYYPRARTPEFCVRACSVKDGMRNRWCLGMRFKMPFETANSSRISWFMGTISSVQAADPIDWPNSPWRLLQVSWDEPDLLQDVKRVSPWLVELVPDIPAMQVSSFSPPRKKIQFPYLSKFPPRGHFLIPSLTGNHHGPRSPSCCISDDAPVGIQGARQAQLGIMSSSDHLNRKFPRSMGWLSSPNLQHFNPHCCYPQSPDGIASRGDSLSCLLTMDVSSQKSSEKKACFVLFGKPILTEQQIASRVSCDSVSEVVDGKSTSEGCSGHAKFQYDGLVCSPRTSELSQNTGHCKVFLESEDVGRTLDLTILGSYDNLYRKLTDMFGIERSEMLSHVLYEDGVGGVRRVGNEPFSDFIKTTNRITILHAGSGSSSSVGRSLLPSMPAAKAAVGPVSTYT